MPTVPTYDNFQAAPNTLPQAHFSMPEMPDVSGQQARQMGQAMTSAGQGIGQIAMDMQAQANQVRFDAAATQAREALANRKFGKEGFANLRGGDALFRPDNKYLPDEYGEHIQKDFDAITETLGNDMQKQMFARYSSDLLSSFKTEAMAHVNREYQGFHLSQARGTISQRSDDIARSGGDPDAIDRAINGKTEMFEGQPLYVEKGLRQAAYDAAKLTGASDIEANNMARKSISEGLKRTIIDALDKNDVTQADALLKRYGNQDTMDADDVLSVRSHITKAMDSQVGFGVASDVMRRVQPKMQPSDLDRAFGAVINTESGGRQFGADGKPLTSKAGAIGIAQVMPATAPEAAKLAGLPWDENRYRNDPEYNKEIGLAYFKKQVQDFGGDLAYAFAAYNAGPGRLAEAIKKADKSVKLAKNDPTVPVHTWLDFMPEETRNYVAKNMKAYDAGQGQPSRPTFQEIDEALRSDPRIAGNPARYRVAREEAERQFNELGKAIKQREDDALASVYRSLHQNGGNVSALPNSALLAVNPKDIDNVYGFAKKIAEGKQPATDWQLYYELKKDPDALKGADLWSMRNKFKDSEFKNLIEEQQDIQSGKAETKTTQLRSTHDIIGNMMREIGVDPTPKDSDKIAAERAGKIWRAVEERIYGQEASLGRKLQQKEVQELAAKMLTSEEVYRKFWWNKSEPGLLVGSDERIVVPDAERENIIKKLKSNKKTIDENAIENLYRLSHGIVERKDK